MSIYGKRKKTGSYRIAFVVIYFGKLPFYFEAFLRSCEFNPEIDWYIFTDCPYSKNIPENVYLVAMSNHEFCSLASSKMGFSVVLSDYFLYKICDFKPFLGVIFEDYLWQYDFWGHCDLDILWGRIRFYVTNVILDNYDIITSRNKCISGHFCLYRNDLFVRQLILSLPDVKKKLTDYMHCLRMDEHVLSLYLQWLVRCSLGARLKIALKIIPGKPRVYWERNLTTNGDMQRKMYDDDSIVMEWRDGCVYYNLTELMYLHFHELKKTIEPACSTCAEGSSAIRIEPYRIVGN